MSHKWDSRKMGKKTKGVAEASRIKMLQALEHFQASDNQSYTFDWGLSNFERAVVHEQSRKMGLKTRSSGRGKDRKVSVYKTKTEGDNIDNETLSTFNFSKESKEVLKDLFTRHPPEDGEIGEKLFAEHNLQAKKKQYHDDSFRKPLMGKEEIAKKVESLTSRMKSTEYLRKITKTRSSLPIAAFRDSITSTVESHQVVLISGATGCGKTTQVPQYVLEYMWGKGEACKIVCTQPRRVSATSVSERISNERGESIGGDVGYKIRLQSQGGRHSSIMFCTNGILLRVLVSRGAGIKGEASKKSAEDDVAEITHIIVDEIHERDCFADLMLAIIRDMLPSYPHLRLILMSATLDAERYSQYFGGCPIIRVPGFTYPVRSLYLEDVLSFLKFEENNHLESTMLTVPTEVPEFTEKDASALDEAIHLAWSNDEFDALLDLVSSEENPKVYNYQHSVTGLSPLMVFAGKGRVVDVSMLLSLGADCHLQTEDKTTALRLAQQGNHQETSEIIQKHMDDVLINSREEQQLLDKYLAAANPEFIDFILIEQLLRKICIDSEDGAILVFLSGWDDINRTRERLVADSVFQDTSKFMILPLHSRVPYAEQKQVFQHPPPGCRKIVLSTNIAETAITIDDVVYVIDSGRMKEKSYDPYNNISTLQSTWVSKANAKQREGRAGRCQPGVCFHLFSKVRADSFPDFQVPEIKRMPIEELCLQIKLLDPESKVETFLQKMLDPPVPKAIHNAITALQDIGALSIDERLTVLGEKLGRLPVHPLTSKMLFFAILVDCLDPALTMACAADYRDPFTLPMSPDERKKADAAKSKFASLYGGKSDQLAVLAAYDCWKAAKEVSQESRFCSEYFVSKNTMSMLSRMRKQLQSELVRLGFISDDDVYRSLNARDPAILHAVLLTGLYPGVGTVCPPRKNGQKSVVQTVNGAKVRLHPQSINSTLSSKKTRGRPLIVYDEIMRGDRGMFIRSCTIIGPLPLLLLATEIAVAPSKEGDNLGDDDGGDDDDADTKEGMEIDHESSGRHEEKIMSSPDNIVTVLVDKYFSFTSTALDVAHIYCLRERLTAAILFKVTHPRKRLPPVLGESMYAVGCTLSKDGLSGVKEELESVDSLTSRINATEICKPAAERGEVWNDDGFLQSLMNHSAQSTRNTRHIHQGKPAAQKVEVRSGSGFLQNIRQDNSSGKSSHKQKSKKGKILAHDKSPIQPTTLVGYGSGMFGPYGPRGDAIKRQRGNLH